jgi:hypothetical protein
MYVVVVVEVLVEVVVVFVEVEIVVEVVVVVAVLVECSSRRNSSTRVLQKVSALLYFRWKR